jgi:multicomponent Na+:H+ antiporter subunit G
MTTALANGLMLAGALVGLVAGVGLIRFRTPYARFHAAGKASPVAFVLTAAGATIALGPSGGAIVVASVAAMVVTLPFGVHLLYRAVHQARPGQYVTIDELAAPPMPED